MRLVRCWGNVGGGGCWRGDGRETKEEWRTGSEKIQSDRVCVYVEGNAIAPATTSPPPPPPKKKT